MYKEYKSYLTYGPLTQALYFVTTWLTTPIHPTLLFLYLLYNIETLTYFIKINLVSLAH